MAKTVLPYTFEWPHSDEHLIAMGKVIVESASIEQTLQLAIWQLLGVPEEKGSHVTGYQNLEGRVTLFDSVAKATFTTQKDLKELSSVISAIRNANTQRNDIVHGVYWSGKNKSDVILYRYKKAKGTYGFKTQNLTPKGIEKIAAEIYAANDLLIEFLNQRGVVPPPLLKTLSKPNSL